MKQSHIKQSHINQSHIQFTQLSNTNSLQLCNFITNQLGRLFIRVQMGQQIGCCTKQAQNNLGRKQVPMNIISNFPQPILKINYPQPPKQYYPQLYGQFHYQSNPVKKILLKVPENYKQPTKYVWRYFQIWEYPMEKIFMLPASLVKNRTFQQKYTWFKTKLDEQKRKYGKGFNKIRVDPTNVLLSSYQNFDQINFNLETKIVFTDDKSAIDAGGLFREWVNMSINEAFSAQLGMFKLCQTDETAYKIVGNKTNKKIFVQIAKILGFVIGKSLIQQIPLNCYFNRTIFRLLANQPVHLSDLYNYDIQIYNSLKYILENPISEQDLITFSVKITDPFTQKQKQVELKPNGQNQFVNESNKEDFVQRMIKFYSYQMVKPIVDELRSSLYQVVPFAYLQIFQPAQLEMVICGKQTIDVEDWRRNTSYKGYMPNEDIVLWFWEIVYSFDQTMRSNLLHFCTGSAKVPIQGFNFLQCKRGKIRHFNIKYVPKNKDNPFPKGITCFNKLQLPKYQNKEELESMMLAVCQEQIHDFGLDNVRH